MSIWKVNIPGSMVEFSKDLPSHPIQGNHFVSVLKRHVQSLNEKTAFHFMSDGLEASERLNYGALDREASCVADRLRQTCPEGSRVLLVFPPGLEFISAFIGCLYAQMVAVPLPTAQPQRIVSAALDCDARVLLEKQPPAQKKAVVIPHLPKNIRRLAIGRFAGEGDRLGFETDIKPSDLAFLQYTSGSTGEPKGVMIRHENLMHNQEMMRTAFGVTGGDVIAGWLPLFHDMGLIGNALQTLYTGTTCYLMPPAIFLQRPLNWLKLIAQNRVTISGAPNFAYELCSRKLARGGSIDLDLSSWRVAYVGAEPIHAETLDRFTRAFEPFGFKREAFFPCYGMAETTLFFCGGPRGRIPTIFEADDVGLKHGRARHVEAGGRSKKLVGCGRAWHGQDYAIVSPRSGKLRRPGQIGEIWVKGKSVAKGYWKRPNDPAFGATLHASDEQTYFRSGDLGFRLGDQLFVTGRLKDLIIIRGQNIFPNDVENTVQAGDRALVYNRGAAFALQVDGMEHLIVVQEVARTHLRRFNSEHIRDLLRQRVVENHGVRLHDVVFLKPNRLPITTSGKVRRQTCRKLYMSGKLMPFTINDGTNKQAPPTHEARIMDQPG